MPDVQSESLATCTQIEANIALAEWQAEKRAFEAKMAAVEAVMSEPQQVTA